MRCKIDRVMDLLDEKLKRLVGVVGNVHVYIVGLEIGWGDFCVCAVEVAEKVPNGFVPKANVRLADGLQVNLVNSGNEHALERVLKEAVLCGLGLCLVEGSVGGGNLGAGHTREVKGKWSGWYGEWGR